MFKTSTLIVGLVVVTVAATEPASGQCPNNVPHEVGTWRTLPYGMPVNPISATLLHTGKVLVVAGSENDADNFSAGADTFRNVLWDPTVEDASSLVIQNINYDVFCSGTAQLPHGRTLTIGGTGNYSFIGESRASFFDPVTEQYVQSQSMANGRWYGTATTLGDGRIMAFSGLGNGGSTNKTVEIYSLGSAGSGWGSASTAQFTPPLFPRQFLLPNGKVFFTAHGGGVSTTNAWIFDPVPKTWASSVAKTVDRRYGSAVLLPLHPPSYTPIVMMFGGGSPVTRTTEFIDLSAASPHWTAGPDMSAPRIEMNAVILPDGTVFAEGGSASNENPDPGGKSADLYDPVGNAVRIELTDEFGKFFADLGFKADIKSPILMVVDSMNFGNFPHHPGEVAAYFYILQIPPFVLIIWI